MEVDPKYEFIDAPQFVDFRQLQNGLEDHEAEKYFGRFVQVFCSLFAICKWRICQLLNCYSANVNPNSFFILQSSDSEPAKLKTIIRTYFLIVDAEATWHRPC